MHAALCVSMLALSSSKWCVWGKDHNIEIRDHKQRVCTCPMYSIQVSECRVSVLQKDVHEVYSVPYSCCTAFPKLVIFGVIKLSLVGLLSAADVRSSHVFCFA